MYSIYQDSNTTIYESNRKCYTRLSIGSEQDGAQSVWRVYNNNELIVMFKVYLLLYYTPESLGLEGFSNIYSTKIIEDLIRCLKDCNIKNNIIEEFIEHISKEINQKNILYIV